MRRLIPVVCLLPLLLPAGCASPRDRAALANEEIAKRRIELINQHQSCVMDAKGDQQKIHACDVYLKEAEALK